MNILIKSAKIIDVNSKYHNKNYDILIQDEVITHIDKIIKLAAIVSEEITDCNIERYIDLKPSKIR